MKHLTGMLAWMILAAGVDGFADVVVLKNGQRLTGLAFIQFSHHTGTFLFKRPDGTSQVIELAQIDEIFIETPSAGNPPPVTRTQPLFEPAPPEIAALVSSPTPETPPASATPEIYTDNPQTSGDRPVATRIADSPFLLPATPPPAVPPSPPTTAAPIQPPGEPAGAPPSLARVLNRPPNLIAYYLGSLPHPPLREDLAQSRVALTRLQAGAGSTAAQLMKEYAQLLDEIEQYWQLGGAPGAVLPEKTVRARYELRQKIERQWRALETRRLRLRL